MKKLLFLFLFSSLFSLTFAQDDDYYTNDNETDDKGKQKKHSENRWVFGGNLGLQFGTYTYLNLSPVALYKVNQRLYAGPGIVYIYENYKPYNYKSSTYGVRAIATYSLFKNLKESIGLNIGDIVLQVQNEFINKDLYYEDNSGIVVNDGRGWIDNLLIGGGLYQPFGSRGGGMSLLVLWDITQNKYSTYANPVIQFGFFF